MAKKKGGGKAGKRGSAPKAKALERAFANVVGAFSAMGHRSQRRILSLQGSF